jgi:hypothetical protein
MDPQEVFNRKMDLYTMSYTIRKRSREEIKVKIIAGTYQYNIWQKMGEDIRSWKQIPVLNIPKCLTLPDEIHEDNEEKEVGTKRGTGRREGGWISDHDRDFKKRNEDENKTRLS